MVLRMVMRTVLRVVYSQTSCHRRSRMAFLPRTRARLAKSSGKSLYASTRTNAESAERYVGRVTAGKSCRSRRFYFRIFKIDFLPMRRYWFSCVHSLFFGGLSFKGEGAASSIGKESSMIRNSGHPILH